MINENNRKTIQQNLLMWYREHQRDLPWRRDKDPYKIWVSEIMLQQTRVDTVIPYYNQFIKKFPSLHQLAQADEEEVIKAWEGLGYYSRARNLHAAVKEVVAKYGGKVPSTPEEISSLKGVGSYTTGAILSIAYNQKLAAVDGNVLRVISRLFSLTDDIAKSTTRKKFEKIVLRILPDHSPGDFNQALMELGATICTPTSPTCLICPLREVCKGFADGLQDELPIKKKLKSPKKVPVIFLWITDGEYLLLEKRKKQGLLAGMWGLPTIEHVPKDKIKDEVEKYIMVKNIEHSSFETIGSFEHIFSHRHWQITLLRISVHINEQEKKRNDTWFRVQDLPQIALARVYQKAYQLISSLADSRKM